MTQTVCFWWTSEEDAYLREHFPAEGGVAVAACLGRTINAVRHRAKVLGVRREEAWTAEQDRLLREGWGKVKTRVLAAEIGKSPNAVKQHARKTGLDSNRYYTSEEIALVRELYASHTAAEIARRIHGTGRAAKAVYRLAVKLGLRKWPHWEPEVLERVRALHAEGLNDNQIAARMADVFRSPDARSQVMHIRRVRLKLPVNVEAVREAGRRAVRTQFERLGVKNAAEVRALSYRRYAAENGWPEDLRPREVQILNLLCATGLPMTKRQLAEGVGARTDRIGGNGRPVYLSGGQKGKGTYTAELVRRRLLKSSRSSRPLCSSRNRSPRSSRP